MIPTDATAMPVSGGGMTPVAFARLSHRFQRTHVVGLAIAVLGTVALSADAAVSLLCGGALGALFFWILLRAAYPLFVTPTESPLPLGSGDDERMRHRILASTRRRLMFARALILIKPLVFFGVVWACMKGLRLEPLSFTAGFMTLPASLAVGAWRYVRRSAP